MVVRGGKEERGDDGKGVIVVETRIRGLVVKCKGGPGQWTGMQKHSTVAYVLE